MVGQVRKLDAGSRWIREELAALGRLVAKDPLSRRLTTTALANLLERFTLRHMRRLWLGGRLNRAQGKDRGRSHAINVLENEIPPLEEDVLALSYLVDRQRLEMLSLLTAQLSKAQERLAGLLARFRGSRSAQNKKALLREMARVEALIKKIMARLSKLSRRIPDEYLNLQALRRKDGLSALKRMRQALQQGSLEKAAAELARLARSLERMVSAIEKYRNNAGGGRFSKLGAALAKMVDQLHAMEKEQLRLARKTEVVRRSVERRRAAEIRRRLEAVFKELMREAKAIEAALGRAKGELGRVGLARLSSVARAVRYARDLVRVLAAGDLKEARSATGLILGEARSLMMTLRFQVRLYRRFGKVAARRRGHLETATSATDSAEKAAVRLVRRLDELLKSGARAVRPQDRARLSRGAASQKKLEERLARLRRRMGNLARRLPVFGKGPRRMLREAGQHMGRSRRGLAMGLPVPAHGQQVKAADKLRRARQVLQRGMKRQGSRGGTGSGMIGRQKVKIPGPGDHKPPRELRQDILKAMKDGVPRSYREQVRRYYEELVR